MNLPVIVIGAGGHARVVVDVLMLLGHRIVGATDSDDGLTGTTVGGVPVIGNDNAVLEHAANSVALVNAIGSVHLPARRQSVFDAFKANGYAFETLVHPAATLASGVSLGEGAQVMASAVIQPDARLGSNVIVNTGVLVDHDSTVGDHTHVAPGAVVSGGVEIGEGCHIGAGAVVIQDIRIGPGSLVAAGSVVVDDVPAGSTMMGVPARSRGL